LEDVGNLEDVGDVDILEDVGNLEGVGDVDVGNLEGVGDVDTLEDIFLLFLIPMINKNNPIIAITIPPVIIPE
jgi:hypothetical protein